MGGDQDEEIPSELAKLIQYSQVMNKDSTVEFTHYSSMEYTIPRILQDSHSLSPSTSLVQVKTKFQSNYRIIIEKNVKIVNDKRKQIGSSGKRMGILANHKNDTLTWYVIKPIVPYPYSLSDWKYDEYQ